MSRRQTGGSGDDLCHPRRSDVAPTCDLIPSTTSVCLSSGVTPEAIIPNQGIRTCLCTIVCARRQAHPRITSMQSPMAKPSLQPGRRAECGIRPSTTDVTASSDGPHPLTRCEAMTHPSGIIAGPGSSSCGEDSKRASSRPQPQTQWSTNLASRPIYDCWLPQSILTMTRIPI
jgi:hypothetical protein